MNGSSKQITEQLVRSRVKGKTEEIRNRKEYKSQTPSLAADEKNEKKSYTKMIKERKETE